MIFGMLGRGIDSALVGQEGGGDECSIQEMDVPVCTHRLRSAYLTAPSGFHNAGNITRRCAPYQHYGVAVFEASQSLGAFQ